jgi:hypothetical protein
MTGVEEEARSWGDRIGAGLVDGLLSQLTPVGGAMAQLASVAAQQFRDVMQINSPSRLFHEYGQYMGQGLVGGVESEEGNAREAVEGLGAARPMTAGGGARGGMSGPVNIYLQLPPGGTSEEAVSFAQRVREALTVELPTALQVAFAGAAVESGEG